MRITRVVKGAVKPFVNVPAWLGLKQLSDSANSIVATVKNLFFPKHAERTETFEQSLVRLGLTEAHITRRRKEFKILLAAMLIIAVALLGYTSYLIWQRSIHGAIAAFAITLVALAQAFRYHFWLFQMKQRKLGCTFREWLTSSFL